MSYDRSGGKAGQDIVLYMQFQQNGIGADIFDIQQVEIYDPLLNLIDTITDIENIEGIGGLYKIQWSVPVGSEVGMWTDVWKNIKVTPIAEYFDSSNNFFIVPEAQVIPNTPTTTIYMYVRYPNGEPQVGIYGYVELLDTPYYLGGAHFTNPTPRGTRSTSNTEGMLYWNLPQGARVRVSIPSQGIALLKQLPSETTETDVYSLGDL